MERAKAPCSSSRRTRGRPSHGREAERIRPASPGEEDFNRAAPWLDSQLTHPPPTIRSFHATGPQSYEAVATARGMAVVRRGSDRCVRTSDSRRAAYPASWISMRLPDGSETNAWRLDPTGLGSLTSTPRPRNSATVPSRLSTSRAKCWPCPGLDLGGRRASSARRMAKVCRRAWIMAPAGTGWPGRRPGRTVRRGGRRRPRLSLSPRRLTNGGASGVNSTPEGLPGDLPSPHGSVRWGTCLDHQWPFERVTRLLDRICSPVVVAPSIDVGLAQAPSRR
jgi:hypothetical protein